MSESNGTAKKRTLANPTRRYTPSMMGGAWWGYGSAALDGAPFFTYLDVPRMLRDPRVRLAERMWRAPFQRVKWRVRAESPRVARYVGTTLRRFWREGLPKLLSRYFRYGFAPGGAEFGERKGLVRLECVRAVEPVDARPRVWTAGPNAGRPAGVTLGAGGGLVPGAAAEAWVGPEHAFWFAGMGEFGPFHDVPPMSGMFEPWLEKRGRNGAVHSRRLWYRKCAFRGGKLYHPPGQANLGTDESPRLVDNQDLARQTLEYGEAGAVYTFANDPNTGLPGKYAWELEDPAAQPDVKGVLDYPKQLDGEMLEGAGIPPEVLEAADVGSGWSGRLIPLMAFLGGIDELAGLVVRAADSPIHHAVGVNFGRGTWYEVEPQSLAEEVQTQAKGGKGGGDEGPNPVAGLLGLGGRDPGRDPVTRPTGGGLPMSDPRADGPPTTGDIADRARALARRRNRDPVGLIAIAMLKAQESATRRGKPDGAAPYLDQLRKLAADPDRLAEVTGVRSMSWVPHNGPRGGHGWKNTTTGRVVYQADKPGEKQERARASGQKAREVLTRVASHQATPDDLAELADHLPALPVARLRNARVILGASWGGSKVRREGMVAALLEHVRGRVQHERANPPPADPPPPEPEPEKKGRAFQPQAGKVYTLPTSHIHVDPARFQFKLNTDNPAGVTDELKQVHTWNPDFAGIVSVWHDPADGKTYVVNGHHRRELAGRLGAPDLAVRFIDAPDAQSARAKGALINIAEGRGTAVDAAKFMRDAGVGLDAFERQGVPLKSGALAEQAAALTHLNDAAFDRLARGDLSVNTALAVARNLADPVRQEKVFAMVEKKENDGRELSDRTVAELARQMAAAPTVQKTDTNLFGTFTDDEDTFIQRAELTGHVRAELAKELSDFAAVANERRAGRVAGAGNILNVDENKRLADAAEQGKNLFNQLANRKGPIADALNAGAVKLAAAKTKKERERVRAETLNAARVAIRTEFAALNPPGEAQPGGGG